MFEYIVRSTDVAVLGVFRQRLPANRIRLNGGAISHATNGISASLQHSGFTAPVNQSVDGSGNRQVAKLSGLSISNVALDQNFAPNRIIYNGTLSEGSTGATATATPQSGSSASIVPADADSNTPGHQVDLQQGYNEITVAATRSGNPSGTYSVTVLRRAVGEVHALRVVSVPGSDNNYITGDGIEIEIEFNEQVSVDTTGGVPTLNLVIGNDTFAAAYSGIDPSGSIATFAYSITHNDHDQNGISLAADSLGLQGGAIRTRLYNADAALNHAGLGDRPAHRVNKGPEIAPGVEVTTMPPGATANTYGRGEHISFTVTFDSDMVVDTG